MKKNLRLPFLLLSVLALTSWHKNGPPRTRQAPHTRPVPAFPYNHVTGGGVAS